MSNRAQSVSVSSSDFLPVECVVPQGSVLCPILFILYINDIVSLNVSGKFTLFADDTTILWYSISPEHLTDTITNDLVRIKAW